MCVQMRMRKLAHEQVMTTQQLAHSAATLPTFFGSPYHEQLLTSSTALYDEQRELRQWLSFSSQQRLDHGIDQLNQQTQFLEGTLARIHEARLDLQPFNRASRRRASNRASSRSSSRSSLSSWGELLTYKRDRSSFLILIAVATAKAIARPRKPDWT